MGGDAAFTAGGEVGIVNDAATFQGAQRRRDNSKGLFTKKGKSMLVKGE